MRGWFTVHHETMKTVVGSDDRLLGLYVRLNDAANYGETWHDGYRIERGQLVLTDRTMQAKLYPAASKPPCVKTITERLRRLQDAGAIEIAFLPSDGARLVTVIEYGPDARVDAVKTAAPTTAPSAARTTAPTAAPSAAPTAAPTAALIRSKEGEENKPTTSTTELPPELVTMLRDELMGAGVGDWQGAIVAIADRGLPLDYVRELQRRSSQPHPVTQQAPGPAQLHRWINGTNAPIEPAEWEQRQRERADTLRRDVTDAGKARNAEQWRIEAATFRKLTEAELQRFASDAERAAAERFKRESDAAAANHQADQVTSSLICETNDAAIVPRLKASPRPENSENRLRELSRQLAEPEQIGLDH